MAKTWDDGSYKFKWLEFNLYRAVDAADDMVMRGVEIDEACKKAAEATGYTGSADNIKLQIVDAYDRHSRAYSGLRESIDKNTLAIRETREAVEETQTVVRNTARFKALIGHEEEIEYYHNIGATNAMLAKTFGTSASQISKFLKQQREGKNHE